MKQLILLRHAKSDWSHSGLADYDRPLNKRGLREASLMAMKMEAMGIVPDRITSSPANRALTTARLMAEQYGLPLQTIQERPSLYLGSLQDLASTVEKMDETVQTLMLVAHNPGISWFASFLSQKEINMPTCCAVILKIPQTWQPLSSAEDYRVYKPKDYL